MQSDGQTPWILVISDSPNYTANMVVRGPMPLNCVQLLPRNMNLDEFSTGMTAAVSKADALTKIHFASTVSEALTRKFFFFFY